MSRLANAGLALLAFAAFLFAQSVFPPAGGSGGVADTAKALAANPANCSAGNYPLGVDASGAVENCTAALSVSGYYLYDGTNYYIGPNFRTATLPVDGNFSWVTTQGGASVATVGNAITITAPGNNGNQMRARGLSMGANTTVTAAFSFTGPPQDFYSGGIGLRESGTDKIFTAAISVRFTTGQYSVRSEDWASQTGAVTTRFTGAPQSIINGMVWFRLQQTGGNVIASWSQDGTNFSTFFSEAQTTPFTTAANQFIFWANVNKNGGDNEYITLYSWAVS